MQNQTSNISSPRRLANFLIFFSPRELKERVKTLISSATSARENEDVRRGRSASTRHKWFNSSPALLSLCAPRRVSFNLKQRGTKKGRRRRAVRHYLRLQSCVNVLRDFSFSKRNENRRETIQRNSFMNNVCPFPKQKHFNLHLSPASSGFPCFSPHRVRFFGCNLRVFEKTTREITKFKVFFSKQAEPRKVKQNTNRRRTTTTMLIW